jgi:parallel beta-helix repeat protein
VTNNTVTHHGSPGTTWGGTGILIQSSPNVLVEGNTVTANQDYGIAASGYTSYGGSYATGTIVRNNTVEANGQGIRIEKMSLNTTIETNTITGNGHGIYVGSAPNTYPIPPAGTVIHNNMIDGNTTSGLSVETDVSIVDAINNWWGDISGPSGSGYGSGDAVSTNVTFTPWHTDVGVSNTFVDRNTVVTDSGDYTVSLGTTASAIKTGTCTPTITVAQYSVNPGSVTIPGDIGKYIDVYVPNYACTDQIQVRLYYTDAQVAGLVESSLRLYWWNHSTLSWVQCSNSNVNTTSNYIYADITGSSSPTLSYLTGQGFGGGGNPLGGGGGGTSAPAFPSIYVGTGVALGAGVIAYFVHRRMASQKQQN